MSKDKTLDEIYNNYIPPCFKNKEIGFTKFSESCNSDNADCSACSDWLWDGIIKMLKENGYTIHSKDVED